MSDGGLAPGSAAVHVRSYAREQAAHAHPFHQLVVPVAGELELELEGRAGRVSGRSCVLVAAGERHAFAGSGDNRFAVVDFDDAVADEAGARRWLEGARRSPFFAAGAGALRLASLLAGDAGPGGGTPGLQRAWATLVVGAAAAAAPAARPAAVERALDAIRQRALGPLEVREVARAAGVSVRHLHALFRAHLGATPHGAILERRLSAARELLAGSDAPIAEIALRCGFADQASFTHAMRRVLGCTPGRLRRSRS